MNGKTNEGLNALHWLCLNNSSEKLIDAIQLLIQSGIDMNGKTNEGRNALHVLCRFNSSEKLIDAIQLLIRCGIEVKSENNDARILIRNNFRQKKETVDGIVRILDKAARDGS
jgi:ankyrin repeat protein